MIRANDDNTGTITIGTKGNEANGYILRAGESSPRIYLDDLSKVFIVGSGANQGYSYLAI